jgi:hypothetical protein
MSNNLDISNYLNDVLQDWEDRRFIRLPERVVKWYEI